MEPLEELSSHLAGSSRAIVISDRDVDLRAGGTDTRLFVLKIGEGSLAAGGRGGGFGERKVTGAFCFQRRAGVWARLFAAGEAEHASRFEVPYHVSRLPMVLADGAEMMGYGVVDQELVAKLSVSSGIASSA